MILPRQDDLSGQGSFQPNSKETMSDKIIRMFKNEVSRIK
ncbi:MAG: hypothetical protein LBH28_07865 [Oscillospiraceae bacterium]|nr:hypothetical protein [Oscillospiraceae bacterium]